MNEINVKTKIQKLQQQVDDLDKRIGLFQQVLNNDTMIDDDSARILRSDIKDFTAQKIKINNQILKLKTEVK